MSPLKTQPAEPCPEVHGWSDCHSCIVLLPGSGARVSMWILLGSTCLPQPSDAKLIVSRRYQFSSSIRASGCLRAFSFRRERDREDRRAAWFRLSPDLASHPLHGPLARGKSDSCSFVIASCAEPAERQGYPSARSASNPIPLSSTEMSQYAPRRRTSTLPSALLRLPGISMRCR